MKKMVVMMNVYDEESKKRIIQTVARCPGITTITMDSKEGKLTVIGEFNIMKILSKLDKKWKYAKIATFGPYDPKKEAESAAAAVAAAAAAKRQQEEREREEALHRSYREIPIHHHNVICDHDHYQGCVIS